MRDHFVRKTLKRGLPLTLWILLVLPADGSRRTPVVEAVERSLPSIVNIGTERVVKVDYQDPLRRRRGNMFDQLMEEFFLPPSPPGYEVRTSLGSGVVIDPGGYILTNFHVIERASVIKVTTADEVDHIAQVVATDEINDLALLQVLSGGTFQAVTFAEDDDLLLGETVISLGNPFGLGHTVTVGVLSSKSREARYRGEVLYRDILQTDAAVNPGNSGGPLLNINGDLIGINVAIYPEAQNIGFAVPVKRVRALLGRWLSPRILKKTWLGIVPVEGTEGVVVGRIGEDAPPQTAGLRPGQEILSVNGQAIHSLYEYNRALLNLEVGDAVELGVRQGRQTAAVELKLVKVPKPSGETLARLLLGLEFSEAPRRPGRRVQFRKGLPIKSVLEDGPAETVGLRPGLLVTRINSYEVRTLDDVGLALEQVGHGEMVALEVVSLRESETFIIAQSSVVRFQTD